MFENRSGKNVLVFGGTGSIGKAVCAMMAAEGANLAFTCRSNRAGAEALAGELARDGQTILWDALANEDRTAVAAFTARVAQDDPVPAASVVPVVKTVPVPANDPVVRSNHESRKRP